MITDTTVTATSAERTETIMTIVPPPLSSLEFSNDRLPVSPGSIVSVGAAGSVGSTGSVGTVGSVRSLVSIGLVCVTSVVDCVTGNEVVSRAFWVVLGFGVGILVDFKVEGITVVFDFVVVAIVVVFIVVLGFNVVIFIVVVAAGVVD